MKEAANWGGIDAMRLDQSLTLPAHRAVCDENFP
jgi:hypothetical protein